LSQQLVADKTYKTQTDRQKEKERTIQEKRIETPVAMRSKQSCFNSSNIAASS
jgi:hypothetical protein